jgi:hypothetical protein
MDVGLATEEQKVEMWVLSQLQEAGFDGDQIGRLLQISQDDPEAWRRAVTYVQQGCEHALAVRIVC